MIEILILASIAFGGFCLTALSVIDLKHGILPNKIVTAFALTGLSFHLLSNFHFNPPLSMITGALLGGGILYAIRFIAMRFYGPNALGLGDVKLLAAAGIWLGPENVLNALIIGALAGIIHGLLIAGIQTMNRQSVDMHRLSVKAGPGFAIGITSAFIMLFLGIKL